MRAYLSTLGFFFCSLACFACASSDSASTSNQNPTDASTDHTQLDSAPIPDSANDTATKDSFADSAVEDAPKDVTSEPSPCVGSLKINEVRTEGATGATDEFVELFNPSDCLVHLDDISLVYRSGNGATDQAVWAAISGQTLKPNTYFVLGGKNYSGNPDFAFNDGIDIATVGGGLALKQGVTTVDLLGWGTALNAFVDNFPAPAPLDNKSIGRIPNGKDTDDNQVDFKITQSTPRAANKQ